MISKRLKKGDTIGVITISHIATPNVYATFLNGIRKAGYIPKEGNYLYANTYGYLASPEERAADFNDMILDPSVRLVIFGGGEGSNEILPLIDYEAIKTHPKLISSFSDGTTPLNAIWARTGLEVYYGQGIDTFVSENTYNRSCFQDWFVNGNIVTHKKESPWRSLTVGKGNGILVGGYSRNFAMMQSTEYFSYDPKEDYLLILEDHEKYGGMSYVSAMLSHLEQSDLILHTVGLIYGHYSDPINPYLLERLTRIGEKYHIPVAQTDDFGHGVNRAIFPIGRRATLTVTHKGASLIYDSV